MNFTKGSYQQELDNFFTVTTPGITPSQVVTKSALTQARKHLSHTAFIDLNQQVINAYYADHPDLKTWKGFRLCTIDGSQFRLSNTRDIIDAFGVNPGRENQKDCALGLASIYYDVLNHTRIDASINHTKTSEKQCAALHLQHAQPNDLSLLDRGYNAFWLYNLYHLRWGIEENYKRLKQWFEIENFSGKSALSVKQDFYAKVLTTNLISMIANEAQAKIERSTSHRQHTYQINFAQAISKMKNTILEFLYSSTQYLRKKLKDFIDYIACTIEPVRKERSYSRPKSKMKNKLHFSSYKRAR